eukprot:11909025-Prorocentrum_lima.AAC.1
MRWAVRQRKHIVETAVDPERHVGTDDVFGDFAEDDEKIENLQTMVRHMYTYLISFTTGDANKIVRNTEGDNGLEAWRRLNKEHDPSSSIRRVTILGQ